MNTKTILSLLILSFMFASLSTITSCKVKEGCGYEEKMAPKVDRDGKLSRERGKSKLFG